MGCQQKCSDCCECLSPIPNGGTCQTACAHFARCNAIFGQEGPETCCQWIPSRFLPAPMTRETQTIHDAAKAIARVTGFSVSTTEAAVYSVIHTPTRGPSMTTDTDQGE